MIKPNFEIFRKDKDTLGVIIKSQRLFSRMNKVYKRYSEDTRLKKGEEALFWVSESLLGDCARILGMKALPERID